MQRRVNRSRKAISILSGKYKRFTFIYPVLMFAKFLKFLKFIINFKFLSVSGKFLCWCSVTFKDKFLILTLKALGGGAFSTPPPP